jgi:hypothetical protein
MKLPRYVVIGRHQIFALLLLAIFSAQCAWRIGKQPFTTEEQDRIWSGRQQLEYGSVPRKFGYSPLVNVASAAPLKLDADRKRTQALTAEAVQHEVRRLHWMLRAPFLLAGILLGVSIWYVARRLYGNPGGYIALALYCFSPVMVLHASRIHEGMPSTWGVFGIVFTAIAISHNLYAPWRKWRYRFLLLSVAMALAIASHPAAMIVVPLAFAYILYLAPGRRLLATGLMLLSMLFSAILVSAAYNFVPRAMLNGIDLREWLAYQPAQARAAFFADLNALLLRFNPAMLALLLVAVITYFVWKRTRYFGNTSPLITAAALIYVSLITPLTFTGWLWVLPFLYVFIGGIWADLLETRRGIWVLGALIILLGENAWYCLQILRSA